MRWRIPIVAVILLPSLALADGPADNIPANVRRIPKLGIEVPADRRAALEAGLAKLSQSLNKLREAAGSKSPPHPRLVELLPDVEVYHKAVHDALAYQEFFDPKEIDFADAALVTGQERARQLAAGQAPWTTATGLVVRGYVSKLDGSVQPYGLVVPESYTSKGPGRFRCDLWFHGRGETLSELNFIRDRTNNVGAISPEDTIVLHPYGRYSNAFKLAGEIDVLEALESAQKRYRIDDDRIAARGFSMGGAAAWHFAVHYPDRWFAANPGAGFSETPEFLKVFQQETLKPTWWEQKLWQLYDCNGWAINLRHCPTVAYSGELDSQKQAADVMQKALAEESIDLVHIIGPQTRHAIHPQSKLEIEERMKSLARIGRDWQSHELQFSTFTLRYNRMQWLTVDGLAEHWTRADVAAAVLAGEVRVDSQNVTDLTLSFAAGESPLDVQSPVILTLGDQELEAPAPRSDKSWTVSVHKVRDEWRLGKRPGSERPGSELRKRHALQGPIDDAFMDSFLFVRPTGKPQHEQPAKWAASELDRAIEHWRRHFRGVARVKDDTSITPEDMAASNLVLWGDPGSNAVLRQIADKLPIHWDEKQIDAGEHKFASDKHALIAIYPNPLKPVRYVVLNSGFTFRDYAYLNNARQVPMLPDWAVVDLTTPPNSVWPGKIVDADFFDENWQLKVSPERK
ncbi:MAG: prolyl oligopeptidase family serine peptidase [Planctomycetaceae bacterium]|nr:prolyl oligopeptidase family serine peptidase [Planctomycetaceae bacterium]